MRASIRILVMLPLAALAAGAVEASAPSSGPGNRRVLVPLEHESATFARLPSHDEGPSLLAIELTGASWLPEGMALPSGVAGVSAFGSNGLPSLGLAASVPAFPNAWRTAFRARLSAAFFSLRRTGPAYYTGVAREDEQNLYGFSLMPGLEARPARLRWGKAGLRVTASLGPMFASAPRATFAEDASAFGMATEASVGPYLRLGAIEAIVEATGNAAWIAGGRPAGLGARAALGFPL